jgi:hypothetical protein
MALDENLLCIQVLKQLKDTVNCDYITEFNVGETFRIMAWLTDTPIFKNVLENLDFVEECVLIDMYLHKKVTVTRAVYHSITLTGIPHMYIKEINLFVETELKIYKLKEMYDHLSRQSFNEFMFEHILDFLAIVQNEFQKLSSQIKYYEKIFLVKNSEEFPVADYLGNYNGFLKNSQIIAIVEKMLESGSHVTGTSNKAFDMRIRNKIFDILIGLTNNICFEMILSEKEFVLKTLRLEKDLGEKFFGKNDKICNGIEHGIKYGSDLNIQQLRYENDYDYIDEFDIYLPKDFVIINSRIISNFFYQCKTLSSSENMIDYVSYIIETLKNHESWNNAKDTMTYVSY